VDGCKKDHNTLLHPVPADPSTSDDSQSQELIEINASSDTSGVTSARAAVTAATGAL